MSRPPLPTILVLALSGLLTGCWLYTSQLERAERHYQEARYEAALANLEDLEKHLTSLSKAERVKYSWYRGMTHYRIGRDHFHHARHWLAIAREDARSEAAALNDTQRSTIERILAELDPLNPRPPTGGLGGDVGGDGGVEVSADASASLGSPGPRP